MKKLNYSLIVLSLLFLSSCLPYPDEQDYIEDFDVVLTHYDESKDFSSYQTFALPNAIPYLDNNEDEQNYLDDDNPEIANLILDKMRANMENRGYIEVDEAITTPDLLLNLGVTTATYTGIYGSSCGWYGDPFYWGWYPGWGWGSGWGWGYYPCWGSSYYTYSFGSLVFDLVDVENSTVQDCSEAGSDCQLNVAWNGIVRGLLTESQQNMNSRISQSIDQAFVQSPYINNNQ